MTRAKLVKEADRVFSLWIRKRDGNRCVQCGSREQLTCGHIISRRIQSVRFDEYNCHCQCWGCNSGHRYWPHKYTAWYVEKFGRESYLRLVERSRSLKQWKSNNLRELILKYK